MKRLLTLSLFLSFSSFLLFAQDSVSAVDVINRYLDVIGGIEKANQIRSIELQSSRSFRGQTTQFIEKKVSGELIIQQNIFDGRETKAIVYKTEGVNITPEGTFAMPEDQVIRNRDDMLIFPELEYLKEPDRLEYFGTYQLDNNTLCHEIAITQDDGSIIFKNYNIKTGLLEHKSYKKLEYRILEYEEIEGVLFPSKASFGPVTEKMDKIIVNPSISESEYTWNSQEDLKVLGQWETIPKTESETILYLEINSNRSGSEGMGTYVDGDFKEISMMRQYFAGWSLVKDSLTLRIYNAQERKLQEKYFIIKEINENRLIGYFADPELEAEYGLKGDPITLEFSRREK